MEDPSLDRKRQFSSVCSNYLGFSSLSDLSFYFIRTTTSSTTI